jgi:hypothetical protein
MNDMHTLRFRQVTGILLIVTPLIFSLFFSLLQARFNYPAILDASTDQILRQFHAGGSTLIALWYGFLFSAILLIPLVVLMYQLLAPSRLPLLGIATVMGILAGLVQVLGLLRWVFLVPYLSQVYLDPATSGATREGIVVIFQALHAYAGHGIGEHLGYLFTAIWTILIGITITRSSLFPAWSGWLALLPAAGILAGLLTPLGFEAASLLNQLGYIAWSLWLIMVGILVLRSRDVSASYR